MITKRGEWHKHPEKDGFMFKAIHTGDGQVTARYLAEVVPADGGWRVNMPPVPDFANGDEMRAWLEVNRYGLTADFANGDEMRAWLEVNRYGLTAYSATLEIAIASAYDMCKMDVPEPVTVEITGEPSESPER